MSTLIRDRLIRSGYNQDMFLHSISINNVSCFSAENSKQTQRMEFDTDDLTSNVNILIGPNNSGKSQFLSIIDLISHFLDHSFLHPQSSNNQHQTISSMRKTSKQEKESISGLPEFIDIDFDLHTKTYASFHSNISHQIITDLLAHQSTISTVNQSQIISDQIIRLCQTYLGPEFFDRTESSSGIEHIKSIAKQCTQCKPGGIVIIDEPEAHLHPQLQQKLGKILEYVSANQHIQIFLSTHSAQFINESNCINVYRFYRTNSGCTRHNPGGFIGTESSLQQILTQSNMTKIFFSKKIIMCEGDIDQIFLSRFLEYYKGVTNLQPYQVEIEFLPIAGKGSFHMRSNFCKRWKIEASFIGDRDNVFESDLGPTLTSIKSEYNKYVAGTSESKSSRYNGLIDWIRTKHSQTYQQIEDHITQQHQHGVYILSQGDIESYMGVRSKGIESTIDFCKYDFDSRINSEKFKSKHDELIQLFHQIIPGSIG